MGSISLCVSHTIPPLYYYRRISATYPRQRCHWVLPRTLSSWKDVSLQANDSYQGQGYRVQGCFLSGFRAWLLEHASRQSHHSFAQWGWRIAFGFHRSLDLTTRRAVKCLGLFSHFVPASHSKGIWDCPNGTKNSVTRHDDWTAFITFEY